MWCVMLYYCNEASHFAFSYISFVVPTSTLHHSSAVPSDTATCHLPPTTCSALRPSCCRCLHSRQLSTVRYLLPLPLVRTTCSAEIVHSLLSPNSTVKRSAATATPQSQSDNIASCIRQASRAALDVDDHCVANTYARPPDMTACCLVIKQRRCCCHLSRQPSLDCAIRCCHPVAIAQSLTCCQAASLSLVACVSFDYPSTYQSVVIPLVSAAT